MNAGADRYVHAGEYVYRHYPDGSARSKLSNVAVERALGVPLTARNWRTLLKLDEMLAEAGLPIILQEG